MSQSLIQSCFHFVLKKCIRNQDRYNETFQDELWRLFRKYSVEFDERYLWG
jgi:hypothetical protein